MNQTVKNVMGAVIAAAVLALGYASVSYVDSYGKSIQPSSFRSFSVTGEGKVTAIPDIAEFSFKIITQGGTDLSSLQAKNTGASNKVIAFVKSQGVEDKDIKTLYYNVEPRYETYRCNYAPTPMTGSPEIQACPPASIVGYTVTQTVDVKVRNFDKIGTIMGGIVPSGANEVGSLSFTIDDPTKLQDQARSEAITKAKAKAEGIARAGGFKIGRLLNIQEGYNPYSQYKNLGLGGGTMESAAATPAPVIQPGSQEVDVSMTLQYEIE